MNLKLSSAAFKNEKNIPPLYTCKGKNISPPLSWSNPPKETRSFALIMEDTDTPFGTVTHWVIYNIPPDKKELTEAIPHQKRLPDGTVQGRNGMFKNGYMGPCPPWGRHRYYFYLYALDTVLETNPKINKKKLLNLIKDHILDKTVLMGYFSRKE
jgi:Raf kinase inhibitor-like YbhB/YbcL family protein